MTRKILTGLVIGLGAALAVPTIGSALHSTSITVVQEPVAAVTPVAARPSLVEAPECAVAATAPTPADGVVSVSVPNVAFLYFDAAGAITAAATNTGCAPRTGDLVYAYRPGTDGPVAISFDLGSVAWVGDFTAIAVPQPQH